MDQRRAQPQNNDAGDESSQQPAVLAAHDDQRENDRKRTQDASRVPHRTGNGPTTDQASGEP